MRVARETHDRAVPVAVTGIVSVTVAVARIAVRRNGRSVRRATVILVIVMRPTAGSTGPRRRSRVTARGVRLLGVVLSGIDSLEDAPQKRQHTVVAPSAGLSIAHH